MALQIGHGTTLTLLSLGKLLSPQQAKQIGLIDLVVETDNLLTTAEDVMTTVLKMSDRGRVATKKSMRQEIAESWPPYSPESWRILSSPDVISNLRSVLNNLSSKSKL